ncbi:hypothetical protein K7W42_21820 [Deinococcus sp. HMF7604]|uniref:hypothetical protein n=1 Tax=Deinococcus betulae TaxID=2873312 RepID=UPI001CCDE6E2|nr:hypothetical protein [Deinococcus betulae]MBZ9753476.1 hypothetical protein [Deinococcus betulae]
MVRQLHPVEGPLHLNARYNTLCQGAALYRLGTAPLARAGDAGSIEVTAENIQAGLVDFKALVVATRQKLQRDFERTRVTAKGQH